MVKKNTIHTIKIIKTNPEDNVSNSKSDDDSKEKASCYPFYLIIDLVCTQNISKNFCVRNKWMTPRKLLVLTDFFTPPPDPSSRIKIKGNCCKKKNQNYKTMSLTFVCICKLKRVLVTIRW